MALIAILAVAFAPVIAPLDRVDVGTLLVLAFGFLAFAWYVLVVICPWYALNRRPRRCPGCGDRRLLCVMMIMFRPNLTSSHVCASCGSRWKRTYFGAWRVARSPEDDPWFPGLHAEPPAAGK